MSTCQDCRFWNRNGEGFTYYPPPDFEPLETEKKRCLKVLHANKEVHGEHEHVNYLAVLTDGSGYSASLFTEATFGCAMFEARAEKGGNE